VLGLSLYLNQVLSGQGSTATNPETVNKITPIIFSGMFLFFPLPAGVLMYMLIANIFQTLRHLWFPANLCRKTCKNRGSSGGKQSKGRESLPFEQDVLRRLQANHD